MPEEIYEWERDVVKCKIITTNDRMKLDDIDVNVNAKKFVLKSGSEVWIPRAVMNTINATTFKQYKVEGDMTSGRHVRSTESQRYMAVLLEDPKVTGASKEKDEKNEAKVKIKRDILNDD